MVEMTTNDAAVAPAVRAARVARDVVDDVLLQLGRLGGRFDRRALLEGLESARAALDVLERSALDDADHLDCHEVARQRLAACIETVDAADVGDGERLSRRLLSVERSIERARSAAIDALVAGQSSRLHADRRGIVSADADAENPFGASVGVPRLFTLPRAPAATHIDKAIPEDFVPRTFEDDERAPDPDDEELLASLLAAADEGQRDALADEPELEVDPDKRLELILDGPSGDPARAGGLDGELAQLRRMARDCLEDIGAVANLRRLEPTERFDWAAMERFERRMGASLDALVSLGTPFFSASAKGARHLGLDVVEQALTYGRDAVTADPGRCYARTFVLGSLAGEDTPRAAILALKQSPRYTHRAQTQALSLSANPAVDGALLQLCHDSDSDMVRVALDALYARKTGDFATFVTLVEHVDDTIRARALRGLGLVAERDVALELLAGRLIEETSDLVKAAAAEAMTLLGHARGVAYASERLGDEAEEPGGLPSEVRLRLMMLLGTAGREEDFRVLGHVFRGNPGEALALGLHGHFALAELLFDCLTSEEPRLLLGPSQRTEVAEALIRITGAPLLVNETDRYSARADAAAWFAWWREFADELDVERRYRWGKLWSPLAAVQELEADDVPHHVRQACALELAVSLGERPMMLHTFALSQRAELARAKASVLARHAEGHVTIGAWR